MYKSNNSSFGSSFGSYGSGSSNDSPVNVGTQYDVKIEDTARQGDGIARISGLVILFQTQRSTIQLRLKSRR